MCGIINRLERDYSQEEDLYQSDEDDTYLPKIRLDQSETICIPEGEEYLTQESGSSNKDIITIEQSEDEVDDVEESLLEHVLAKSLTEVPPRSGCGMKE